MFFTSLYDWLNRNVFNFVFSEKEENKTAKQNFQRLVYSNPANCNDIRMLGNTLNGYYLVNSSESVDQFGVFFCKFKLPPEVNSCKDRQKNQKLELMLL